MKNYKRKLRNEKIKKVLFLALFVIALVQVFWSASHYSKSGMVWEVNGSVVTVRLADGEMYSYYTNNPPARFEKVNVIFDTNGTEDRFDDKVINVK